MISMVRIQGFSMGFANLQKPILQAPALRGIFDIAIPPQPKFPPMDFPLDAGSLAPADGGGADGGDAPAPAPLPGGEVDFGQPVFPQQEFAFPVQEVPVPTPVPVAAVTPTVSAIPTWALVGGALLAGVVLAKIL